MFVIYKISVSSIISITLFSKNNLSNSNSSFETLNISATVDTNIISWSLTLSVELINSNNLAQDLLSNNENYECFLINQNINHKLTTYLSTIDKSKLVYSVEQAKKLVSDSQYCEKWLEIVKSYLFTVGIDIEKENKNDVFANDAVEKSSDKLKIVLSSLKLVAQISIETRNLELFDRIFDIYCIAYESYVRKPSKLLQQCFILNFVKIVLLKEYLLT